VATATAVCQAKTVSAARDRIDGTGGFIEALKRLPLNKVVGPTAGTENIITVCATDAIAPNVIE